MSPQSTVRQTSPGVATTTSYMLDTVPGSPCALIGWLACSRLHRITPSRVWPEPHPSRRTNWRARPFPFRRHPARPLIRPARGYERVSRARSPLRRAAQTIVNGLRRVTLNKCLVRAPCPAPQTETRIAQRRSWSDIYCNRLPGLLKADLSPCRPQAS